MLPVEQPFKTYTGLDGKPLDNGYVYFGEPNQDPITQPVTVYWDAAGTIPAAQPLRTVNGYITRAGTPANVFYDGSYSELVLDSKERQVFYAQTSDDFSIAAVVLNLVKAVGSSLVGFIQDGVGAVKMTVEAALRERVSVTHFGAKGDGVTNDTASIQKANNFAAILGRTLHFPAGTFMTDPLFATTSWVGEFGTVIKYRGTANVNLVTAEGIDNITFEGLTFDGNVSADPGVWSAANYDTFNGASGLSVNSCDGARIIRCRGQNTWRHGIRTINCTNAVVDGCQSKRSRGNFGDGYFFVDSIGIKVTNCHAYDFTRIGFVFDTFGSDPKTSHDILFDGCTAEYGHDASILYGGGEYNAGAWAENSAHMQVSNFSSKSMPSSIGRGLVMCSGVQNNGVKGAVATFSADNLLFEDCGVGVVAYSQGTFPVAVAISRVKAHKVWAGVSLQGKLASDVLRCIDSFVDVDFAINPTAATAYGYNIVAGLPGKPAIEFTDCFVKHTNPDYAKMAAYGDTTSCADVGAYTGDPGNNGAKLTVRNMRNVDGSPVWVGVPYMQQCDLDISDMYVRIPYAESLGSGSAVIRDSRVHSGTVGNGSASRVELNSCRIEGALRIGGNSVRLEGGTVKLSGTDYIWLFSATGSKIPSVVISGTYFSKNLDGGTMMRIGFGAVAFTLVMSDVQFYNESGVVTNTPCFQYASGLNIVTANVLKDSTATYICDLDSGGAPTGAYPGVTNAAFH